MKALRLVLAVLMLGCLVGCISMEARERIGRTMQDAGEVIDTVGGAVPGPWTPASKLIGIILTMGGIAVEAKRRLDNKKAREAVQAMSDTIDDMKVDDKTVVSIGGHDVVLMDVAQAVLNELGKRKALASDKVKKSHALYYKMRKGLK